MTPDANEVEFDCTDCGVPVVAICPPPNFARRCAGCQWLTELPPMPAEELTALRNYMIERGIIGFAEPRCPHAGDAGLGGGIIPAAASIAAVIED